MTCDEIVRSTGFPPGVWGPVTWALLHALAWDYPLRTKPRAAYTRGDELRQAYATVVRTLGQVLPCRACGRNWDRLVVRSTAPRSNGGDRDRCVFRPGHTLENRRHLTTWLHRAHNCNRRKDGKSVVTSYSDAAAFYAVDRTRERVYREAGPEVVRFVVLAYDPRFPRAYMAFFSALALILGAVDTPASRGLALHCRRAAEELRARGPGSSPPTNPTNGRGRRREPAPRRRRGLAESEVHKKRVLARVAATSTGYASVDEMCKAVARAIASYRRTGVNPYARYKLWPLSG
jgi:hypothetical protein